MLQHLMVIIWLGCHVETMAYMFGYTPFNKDISSWNVENVNDTHDMFKDAHNFNQDLSSWDVSNVTNMRTMFWNAPSFDQDIGNWDVSNVTYV